MDRFRPIIADFLRTLSVEAADMEWVRRDACVVVA
jgi:hypothetical protein